MYFFLKKKETEIAGKVPVCAAWSPDAPASGSFPKYLCLPLPAARARGPSRHRPAWGHRPPDATPRHAKPDSPLAILHFWHFRHVPWVQHTPNPGDKIDVERAARVAVADSLACVCVSSDVGPASTELARNVRKSKFRYPFVCRRRLQLARVQIQPTTAPFVMLANGTSVTFANGTALPSGRRQVATDMRERGREVVVVWTESAYSTLAASFTFLRRPYIP